MSRTLDLLGSTDPRDVVHQAVQALAEGGLVALPFETGYGIGVLATQESAAMRLAELRLTPLGCLAVPDVDAALDFLASPLPVPLRAVKRWWPGSVVLRAAREAASGIDEEFPAVARRLAATDGEVQLLVTGSPVIVDILRLLTAPLATVLPTGQGQHAGDGRRLNEMVGDKIDLIVDAGPVVRPGAPSVVRVHAGGWEMVTEGVVTADGLSGAAAKTVLFVCTGNTCRSPMAAALFRKLLAARLQCSEEELAAHGFRVISAGLSATAGMPASPEAVELMQARGVRMHDHSSQKATPALLSESDYVFTMTRTHRATILQHSPQLASRVDTLMDDGSDVVDPIGFGIEEYRHCAEQISRNLKRVLDIVVAG